MAISYVAGASPLTGIHLEDVDVLTFNRGQLTTFIRSSPYPQLVCKAGCDYPKDNIICHNIGVDDRHQVVWRCEIADLPTHLKLSNTHVTCEGFPLADSAKVLVGSCSLEYEVIPVAPSPPPVHFLPLDPPPSTFADTVIFALFVMIAVIVVFAAICLFVGIWYDCRNCNRAEWWDVCCSRHATQPVYRQVSTEPPPPYRASSCSPVFITTPVATPVYIPYHHPPSAPPKPSLSYTSTSFATTSRSSSLHSSKPSSSSSGSSSSSSTPTHTSTSFATTSRR
jgi:hypothetical protein